MSAAELIEKIQTLSDEEKERVYAFVLAETAKRSGPCAPDVIDQKTFEEAAETVFSKHGDLLRMLAQ